MQFLWLSLICTFTYFATSCSHQVRAQFPVQHSFEHGRSAYLDARGIAHAPPKAPPSVKAMIAAGNELQNKPYKYGGGHRSFIDSGYDCSGAVSYVLHKGGLLQWPLVSQNFLEYGEKGYGKWVDIYARDGHVFMVIAGLRLDTGGSSQSTGPRWKPHRRSVNKYVVRHPTRL